MNGSRNSGSTIWALGLLSAATLAFEVNLTRIFAVAQFYHFAFMIVSLALLGFGASGTLLAVFPSLTRHDPTRALRRLGWGFALATLCSYALTLHLPFDSFRIAHDPCQALVLALHYLALSSPFFCSGMAVGLLLAGQPERSNRIYAANLIGSALGCLLVMGLPSLVGGGGTVLAAAVLGLSASFVIREHHTVLNLLHAALILMLILGATRLPAPLEIQLSPYKSLSYALLLPDADLIFQRWNSFSRVDVVRASGIRHLPGSGFRCVEAPPPQLGLTVDGKDLAPISHVPPGFTEQPFTDCLLAALPYRLRPDAEALVLSPRGGFDVLVALAEGARSVTAIEPNPLVVQAVRRQGDWAGALYDDPRVTVTIEDGRAYARRRGKRYDLVVLALTTPQRTVVSGAYSLAEEYTLTRQAFADYLARLDEDGLLVVTRWLQVPPSESIRAFALAAEALEAAGGDPATSLVALRSYRQMLILARRSPFTTEELAAVRNFAAPRAFDLVYLPDLRPDEVNRYNVLSAPDYYDACMGLLETPDREAWYRAHDFDVTPPDDDRPFFGHFFKWRQIPEVLAMAGRTWQPFGGAGYVVLLALMALGLVAAGALILLPLAFKSGQHARGGPLRATLLYFSLLGMGFLCVEIPLMQRFILFLGHPAYAVAAVLFALLLFSGLGSLLSGRVPPRIGLIAVPLLVGGYTLGLPRLFDAALAVPLRGRLLVAVAALAPLGLVMGMPLPWGMARLRSQSTLVAWAWASNGAVSVVASILAALMALSWGFSTVLAVGATCYVGAWAMALTLPPFARPRR